MPDSSLSPPAVRIHDLRVDYGDQVAVDGISLDIPPGEIFGLIGPNGAGKTSTFKVLATLMEPTYGEVSICGVDVVENPARARSRLGYMPDLAPVPSDLKVGEFLDLFAASYGLRSAERRAKIADALEHVHLTDRRNDYCRHLSRGMKQRLALAKTMLHEPEVMLLDEPASGMDPVSRAALRTTLEALADRGTTVLVSSHILPELSAMATSVGIMSKGRLVASGSMDSVLQQFSGQKTLTVGLAGDTERAEQILREHPRIQEVSVEAVSRTVSGQFDGSDDEQVALLASLVQAECPVRSFSERTSDIESILLGLESDPANASPGSEGDD